MGSENFERGPMTVAEKILYILQVTNWKQQDLADELNVTQSSISAWLHGRAVRAGCNERIDKLYEQVRGIDREQTAPDIPRVLSKGGKLILKFPYYSHQRRPFERR